MRDVRPVKPQTLSILKCGLAAICHPGTELVFHQATPLAELHQNSIAISKLRTLALSHTSVRAIDCRRHCPTWRRNVRSEPSGSKAKQPTTADSATQPHSQGSHDQRAPPVHGHDRIFLLVHTTTRGTADEHAQIRPNRYDKQPYLSPDPIFHSVG